MNVIRWILFLPAAFIASVVVGAVLNFTGQIVAGDGKWASGVTWFFAGILSSFAWMRIGLGVAPLQNTLTKWILLSVLILISLTAGAGSILGVLHGKHGEYEIPSDLDPNWGRLLLAAGMIVTSLFYIGKDPDDIVNDKM